MQAHFDEIIRTHLKSWDLQDSVVEHGILRSKGNEFRIATTNQMETMAGRKSKYSTSFCRQYAKSNNGKFLSSKFLGFAQKHKWKCNVSGHPPFESLFFNMVHRKQWCPRCAGNVKLDIGCFIKYALDKNGKCLSKAADYKNNLSKLKFNCKIHGEFLLAGAYARAGKWCRKCGFLSIAAKLRDPKGLEKAKKLAIDRGGKCLSKKYVNNSTKLTFQCGESAHGKFEIDMRHASQGRWCRKCGYLKSSGARRQTLSHYKKIAKIKGFKILTSTAQYKNAFSKLKVKCAAKEHPPFEITANDLQQNRGCPSCAMFRIEKIVKHYFETYFGTPFPKVRPEWLALSNKRRLELDGYSDKLKIAFEHQGRQHFEVDGYYIKTKADLKLRKQLDAHKRLICKQRGIFLFEIPEIGYALQIEDLPKLLLKQARKNRKVFEILKKKIHIPIQVPQLGSSDYYIRLQNILKSKGGKKLSKYYFGPHKKLEFSCSKGHKWWAPPARIVGHKNRRGAWCPNCNPYRNQFSK